MGDLDGVVGYRPETAAIESGALPERRHWRVDVCLERLRTTTVIALPRTPRVPAAQLLQPRRSRRRRRPCRRLHVLPPRGREGSVRLHRRHRAPGGERPDRVRETRAPARDARRVLGARPTSLRSPSSSVGGSRPRNEPVGRCRGEDRARQMVERQSRHPRALRR